MSSCVLGMSLMRCTALMEDSLVSCGVCGITQLLSVYCRGWLVESGKQDIRK